MRGVLTDLAIKFRRRLMNMAIGEVWNLKLEQLTYSDAERLARQMRTRTKDPMAFTCRSLEGGFMEIKREEDPGDTLWETLDANVQNIGEFFDFEEVPTTEMQRIRNSVTAYARSRGITVTCFKMSESVMRVTRVAGHSVADQPSRYQRLTAQTKYDFGSIAIGESRDFNIPRKKHDGFRTTVSAWCRRNEAKMTVNCVDYFIMRVTRVA